MSSKTQDNLLFCYRSQVEYKCIPCPRSRNKIPRHACVWLIDGWQFLGSSIIGGEVGEFDQQVSEEGIPFLVVQTFEVELWRWLCQHKHDSWTCPSTRNILRNHPNHGKRLVTEVTERPDLPFQGTCPSCTSSSSQDRPRSPGSQTSCRSFETCWVMLLLFTVDEKRWWWCYEDDRR